MIIDTHAHMDDERFEKDLAEVLRRAAEAGVERIVTIGTTVEGSRKALELAEQFPLVWASVGIHPNESAAAKEGDLAAIEELAEHPKVVAVGETGFDFFRDRSSRETQENFFRLQIELAARLGFPLIVHCRDAASAAMDILEQAGVKNAVLHCFAGTVEEARRARSLGFLIGIDAPVTYPKGGSTRSAATAAGLDGILVETDAPYLPPQSRRGGRNEPAFLVETLQTLAALFALPFDEMARMTTATALRFFDRIK